MLNLGGGSDAGALIVTKSDPNNLICLDRRRPTGQPNTSWQQPSATTAATAMVAPYNSKRGDPYFDMDARIAKNIKLGENRKLQLMFQAFNLYNHANYGNNFGNVVR